MTTLRGSGPLVMVDDNIIDIELIKRCHAKSAVPNEFIAFQSGEAFHDHMRLVEAGAAEMPALVLLDINMPLESGFDVLTELRRREPFVSVPFVVLLSNSDHPGDRRRCTELNAGFREKFIRTADAIAYLESLLPEDPSG